MYERIKNYIIGVISKNIKYIRISYEIIIIIVWIYLLFFNKLDLEYFFRACIVFITIILHWYIANKFFYEYKDKYIYNKGRNWFTKNLDKFKNYKIKFNSTFEDKFQAFWINKLINNKKITIKIRIKITNVIYYLQYCCIWIWHYLFYDLIYYEFFYIRIWFMSRLDIIVKKYFKKQINIKIKNYYNNRIYKIFEWCISNPIIKLLIYPIYIKQRLMQRSLYELIQLRLFLYCYISVLLYFGYNDIREYVINNKIILICVIWIYFAIIFPYIIKILIQRYPERDFVIYEKATLYLVWLKSREYVLTWQFFIKIMDWIFEVDKQVERYYYNKVKIWKYFGRIHGIYNILGKYSQNTSIIIAFLKYERSFSVPKYHLGMFYILKIENKFYKMDSLFDEGILRYGIVFMLKEYGHYYQQALLFNKCMIYFIFEMQRLTNQKLEIENWYEKFKFEINYEEIPEKYEGMKLYKEIERYIKFFKMPEYNEFSKSFCNTLFFIPELYKSLYYVEYCHLVKTYSKDKEKEKEEAKNLIQELKANKDNGGFLWLRDRLCVDMYWGFVVHLEDKKIIDIVNLKNRLIDEEQKKKILLEKANDRLKDFYYPLWLEEYNEEVKRLKNVKSIEIVKKEINKYLKNYPGDKKREYEFIISEMDRTYSK